MKRTLTFSSNLYRAKGIYSWDLFRIRFLLRHRPAETAYWLLIRSTDTEAQLDLISGKQLSLSLYDQCAVHVFGVAKSEEDGILLIQTITEDSVHAGFNGNILEFLKKMERK